MWQAWKTLHNARRRGVAAEPIAPADVIAHLAARGVADPDTREWYYDLILGLDSAYMQRIAAKVDG